MKLFTKSNAADAKLGVAERSAYMLGNMGTAFINTVIATFIMVYYTDVLYLNPGIIASLLLASRVFDGVTDIVMGMIVDRTKSRHGRARVWVMRMCIPFAVSGVLLTLVPTAAPDTLKYIYVFITYNLCNAICLTALYVPYNAMTVNMTSDQGERGILGVFVLFGATLGTLVVQSGIYKFTDALGGDVRAWRIAIAVYAVAGLVLHLICILGTKERVQPVHMEKVNAKDEMRSLFKNKYWLLALGAVLMLFFFTSFTGGAGTYFAKGVLGDKDTYASFANAMSITQLIMLFVAFIPMKKIGKRNTFLVGIIIMTAACALQGIFATSLTAVILCSTCKGIGGGLTVAVMYGLVADTIDYGEYITGTKAEGVGVAAITFVTKIANGLSVVVVGWALEISKYDPDLAIQKPSAVTALQWCFSWLPAIFCALAALFMLFYDLDKKYPQIKKELDARRGITMREENER